MLFIGGIDDAIVTAQALQAVFQPYGVVRVARCVFSDSLLMFAPRTRF